MVYYRILNIAPGASLRFLHHKKVFLFILNRKIQYIYIAKWKKVKLRKKMCMECSFLLRSKTSTLIIASIEF